MVDGFSYTFESEWAILMKLDDSDFARMMVKGNLIVLYSGDIGLTRYIIGSM